MLRSFKSKSHRLSRDRHACSSKPDTLKRSSKRTKRPSNGERLAALSGASTLWLSDGSPRRAAVVRKITAAVSHVKRNHERGPSSFVVKGDITHNSTATAKFFYQMLLSDAARVIHMTHSSHNKVRDLELEAY